MNPAASAAASPGTQRLLTLLAHAALVLTGVVVVASAFLRHTQAGLDCAGWPDCYARIAAEVPPAGPSMGVQIARALHRVAASSALVLIIGMLFLAPSTRRYRRERKLTVAALAIALCLAALGVATPDARLPAIPLGNLIGGYLMVAMLAALAGTVASGPLGSGHLSPGLRPLALALLAALFVQAAIGGLIGMQFALQACPALDHCAPSGDAFAPGAALDPFRVPVIVSGHVVPPSGAGTLHSLHRPLGPVIALVALAVAFALRTYRRAAALLAGLAVAAPLLGAAAILHMPSLTASVLHNAAAAAMIATLAYILAQHAHGIRVPESTRRAFSIRRRTPCSEASESPPIRPARP